MIHAKRQVKSSTGSCRCPFKIQLSETPELKTNLCLVPRIEVGNIRDSTIAAKINANNKKQGNTWRVCVDLRNFYLGDKIYEFCRLSQGYIYSPTIFIKFMQRIFCKEQFE